MANRKQSQSNKQTEPTQDPQDETSTTETESSTEQFAGQSTDSDQTQSTDTGDQQPSDEDQQETSGEGATGDTQSATATESPTASSGTVSGSSKGTDQTPASASTSVKEPTDDVLAAVKLAFDDYIETMKPNIPHDQNSLVRGQLKLRKAINRFLNVDAQKFDETIKLVRDIVRAHRSGVFSEIMVFRGFSQLTVSAPERKRLETLVTILLAYADAHQKSQVASQIDFNVAMRYIPKEDEQEKIRSFFNQ